MTDPVSHEIASTHTLGPWHVAAPSDNHDETCEWDGLYVRAATGQIVAFASNGNQANARLLAAAPELLAALKGVLAGFEGNAFCRNTDGDGDSTWVIKFLPHLRALADATVAVEKAEGRMTPDLSIGWHMITIAVFTVAVVVILLVATVVGPALWRAGLDLLDEDDEIPEGDATSHVVPRKIRAASVPKHEAMPRGLRPLSQPAAKGLSPDTRERRRQQLDAAIMAGSSVDPRRI